MKINNFFLSAGGEASVNVPDGAEANGVNDVTAKVAKVALDDEEDEEEEVCTDF